MKENPWIETKLDGSTFKDERLKKRAMCGILMHASLAITPEGLPLGICANKFCNRDKFKGAKSLYRKRNATRIPIEESYRWIESLSLSNNLLKEPYRMVHIADREGDIYELFDKALEENTNFLVRVKVNRRVDNNLETINNLMKSSSVKGKHQLSFIDKFGNKISTTLALKFEEAVVRLPYGPKSNIFPDHKVTIIWAEEIGTLNEKRERISWKIITNLEVNSLEDVIEKLNWYAQRWKIETFFKILKSGCKVESLKLRTADGPVKLISINCILSWRIFWMTMINRECENIPAEAALTNNEIEILDILKPDNKTRKKFLRDYIIKIAKLGGYLARNSDAPPGNIVIWRGIQKLNDIHLGFEAGKIFVGN